MEPSRSQGPGLRACGAVLECYTPRRAEADRHGHHAERSGEHRGGAGSRSPGPTRSSSSTRTARTTPSRSRGGYTSARRGAGRGRATARRRTTRRRSPRTTGSCRSTPTSGSRRRWRTRSGALLAHGAARAAATACRGSSFYLGRWIRGTDWYPDYQLRLYDRRAGRLERPRACTSRCARDRRARARCAHDLQHYPYRDISRSPRHDRSLHDARRGGDGRRRARAPIARHRAAPARSRSCATTSSAAASATARAGFIDLGAELVLRLPEVAKLWELQRRESQPRDRADRATPGSPTSEATSGSRSSTPSTPPTRSRCSPSTSTRHGRGAAGRTRCC